MRRTHLVFAAFVLYWVSLLLRWRLDPLPSAVCLVASLFPDLDYYLRGLPLVEHRKTLHNVWVLSITTYVLHPYGLSVPWLIGYSSHLLLDSLTRSGVDVLLLGRRVKGPFKTGGLADRLLFYFIIAFFAAVALGLFPPLQTLSRWS